MYPVKLKPDRTIDNDCNVLAAKDGNKMSRKWQHCESAGDSDSHP
jgi:hypothetical protein